MSRSNYRGLLLIDISSNRRSGAGYATATRSYSRQFLIDPTYARNKSLIAFDRIYFGPIHPSVYLLLSSCLSSISIHLSVHLNCVSLSMVFPRRRRHCANSPRILPAMFLLIGLIYPTYRSLRIAVVIIIMSSIIERAHW